MFVKALIFVFFLAHVYAQYTITGVNPNPIPLGQTAEVSWTRDPNQPSVDKFTPAVLVTGTGTVTFQENPVSTNGQSSGSFKFFVAQNDTKGQALINQNFDIILREPGTANDLSKPITFQLTKFFSPSAPPDAAGSNNVSPNTNPNPNTEEDAPQSASSYTTSLAAPVPSASVIPSSGFPSGSDASAQADNQSTLSKSKLGTTTIVGIVLGSIAGLLIIGIGGFLLYDRSRKRAEVGGRPFSFNREMMVKSSSQHDRDSTWEFAFAEKTMPLGGEV